MKYLTFILILAFSIKAFLKPELQGSGSFLNYYAPPSSIKYFILGYHEPFSDSLWIRTLQDIDLCENKLKHEIISKDVSLPISCHKGWVYHMLHAITEITPRYLIAYTIGATTLSVLVNDIEGARLIFEKGIEVFPNSWKIAYRAGYHYFYEVKDFKRAAELFLQSQKHGGPRFLLSLAVHSYANAGHHLLALQMIDEFIKDTENQGLKIKLLKRKAEIEAQLKRD